MTLVEVVVALAITGLTVAGIVAGYVNCTTATVKAELFQAADAKALERLEETRSAVWNTAQWPVADQLVASNFPDKVVMLDLPGTNGVGTSAIIQTEIANISANPPVRRVRVDCIWQFRGVEVITNTIETCRAPDQ